MGIPLVKTQAFRLRPPARPFGRSPRFSLRPYSEKRSTPDQSKFAFSIFILSMIILVGLGSIWGVALERSCCRWSTAI